MTTGCHVHSQRDNCCPLNADHDLVLSSAGSIHSCGPEPAGSLQFFATSASMSVEKSWHGGSLAYQD